MRRSQLVLIAALLVGGGVALGGVTNVDAKPRKAAHAKPAKKTPAKKPAKGKGKGKKGAEAEAETETAPAEASSAAPESEPKARVAGASASAGDAGANVVGVTEKGDSGVKVYKFGAQEVEGRLKSPQIIYFLRRVRAEFAAGDLGHRSFMRELSDTRRDPAFR